MISKEKKLGIKLQPNQFVTDRKRSCGKVVSSQASVCPQGVCLSGGLPSWGSTFLGGSAFLEGSALGGSATRKIPPPEIRSPGGGTHPTEMHSCFYLPINAMAINDYIGTTENHLPQNS